MFTSLIMRKSTAEQIDMSQSFFRREMIIITRYIMEGKKVEILLKSCIQKSTTIPVIIVKSFCILGSGSEPEQQQPQSDDSVAAALKDIKMAIQATRVLQHQTRIPANASNTSITSTGSNELTNTVQIKHHHMHQNVRMNNNYATRRRIIQYYCFVFSSMRMASSQILGLKDPILELSKTNKFLHRQPLVC